jgi:hypothetical protein
MYLYCCEQQHLRCESVKCGFLHFTLKDVTADFFYKLSNTSAATMIRKKRKYLQIIS